MNICRLAIALGGVMLASSAYAESPYRFSVGAEHWWGSTKVNEVRKDDASIPSFNASFEHDLPYLPDVSFRYTSVDADYMAFDKYDFTFYYSLIDHDLLHFDAGIALSQFSNSKYVATVGTPNTDTFDELTWNWYGKAAINIDGTNFDIIGQIDFGDSKGLKTTDMVAGGQYRWQLPSGELALKGGYRVIDIESDQFEVDVGGHKPFIFVDGWFVGAEYVF
ncbi:TIGR04219 family outer membrane beta-barrel protein [Vibrio sp. SCSIO 43135]|uniref:TIGR04219 family outer membrane beta-barrel protein n=1 Tax=Vibrio sp. SCSIO 43135 TaxID=2819096 RepID=UPI0020754B2F|nr:TIGR04219 family outer membrane beta-barrel protein [Vibrio sp. SCSIO 43135]USD40859.1 TIGR04219 family outer membrane beta-barrel protein [Vibrio sp. SCSIO 43135]